MKPRSCTLLLCSSILASHPLHAKPEEEDKPLLIRECSSGVDYPDKGDETLAIDHGDLTFHVKILHPKIVEGPHFSTPFFWVSKQGAAEEGFDRDAFVTLMTDVGAVNWNSANHGYFFAEKKPEGGKALRGFLLENGYDNADSGCHGLLFLFDGERASAWNWSYHRQEADKGPVFRVTGPDRADEALPEAIFRRISPVLEHAKEEASGWTGP